MESPTTGRMVVVTLLRPAGVALFRVGAIPSGAVRGERRRVALSGGKKNRSKVRLSWTGAVEFLADFTSGSPIIALAVCTIGMGKCSKLMSTVKIFFSWVGVGCRPRCRLPVHHVAAAPSSSRAAT